MPFEQERRRACVVAVLLVTGGQLFAQANSPGVLTLSQAVGNALKRYPSVQVSQEQSNTAAAAIQSARTAYLPKVDVLAQVNRTTRNNVFGVMLPQSVVPSLSGPVIGSNNLGSVWGSVVGGLVTWEPFDFGLRRAAVAAAEAATVQSQAAVKRTEFELAVAAIDAYLTLIAAQETTRAARAGLERAEVMVKTITARVNVELRPGADQSRAEAELAAARTQLIQAEQAVEVSRANLSQLTGVEPSEITVATESFASLPPEHETQAANLAENPVVVEQNAAVEQARAQLRVLERSYFPRFYLQGAAYARGSGAEIDGVRQGGLNGLSPNFQNYALGFSVTYTISDRPLLRARETAQNASIRSQVARSRQIAVDLQAQWNRAVATLEGARRVARNTPLQVSAARAAVQQASARYQSGLGNIDDLAEAQRLLTQSEVDNALARLGVWRGLLGIAAAAGDVQPFIAEASR